MGINGAFICVKVGGSSCNSPQTHLLDVLPPNLSETNSCQLFFLGGRGAGKKCILDWMGKKTSPECASGKCSLSILTRPGWWKVFFIKCQPLNAIGHASSGVPVIKANVVQMGWGGDAFTTGRMLVSKSLQSTLTVNYMHLNAETSIFLPTGIIDIAIFPYHVWNQNYINEENSSVCYLLPELLMNSASKTQHCQAHPCISGATEEAFLPAGTASSGPGVANVWLESPLTYHLGFSGTSWWSFFLHHN